MSTNSGDDASGHEEIPLDTELSPRSPNASPIERITEAFKEEIKSSSKNNFSQLLMTITSGMYAVMTTPDDGALHYLSLIFSISISLNVITLLILICYRKKKFKVKDGQCPVKTMEKEKSLQKVYRGFSISLIVLQCLFTIVAGVSVSGVMDDDHHSNHTTTVQMETSTVGEYAVNNTSG